MVFYLEHMIIDGNVGFKMLWSDFADQLAKVLVLLQGIRLDFEFVAQFVKSQAFSGYVCIYPGSKTMVILYDIPLQF